jgi:hypothetical protein
MITTNRVRYSAFLEAAKAADLHVKSVDVTRRAAPAYLAELRPHLLPHYQTLSDDDLAVVQCLLVAEASAMHASR